MLLPFCLINIWQVPTHWFLPRRFFALTSLRLLFLIAVTLIVVVCLDQWKHKIWPEIGGKLHFELIAANQAQFPAPQVQALRCLQLPCQNLNFLL